MSDGNPDTFGNGLGCALTILAFWAPFILFAGDPDIADGIIAWLKK